MTRVLVTGASGYLAIHVVKQLLEAGEYIVRGTVRNLANEQKVKPLRNMCPGAAHKLELVEGELTDKECWTNAVKDCTFVIHVASPFPASNPKDEIEVIGPAVEGTRNVLEACAKTKGAVKRVVLTGSGVAVCGGRLDEIGKVFTEEDWALEEGCTPYQKSKLRAEKAAWELVKNLPEDEKFELCVINPGFILGPVLIGSTCTSMELHRRLLQRELPLIPKLSFGIGDVRDIATAHILAMTSPKAPGNRYLAVTDSLWVQDMAKILHQEFSQYGYKVPTKYAPLLSLKVISMFDASMKMMLPSIGKEMKFSNAKIKEHLGYKTTDLKDTIIDMAYSLIDGGFVQKTARYQGREKRE